MAAVDEQRCGNPNCPDPTSTSRLQKIPESFTGPRLSELFHRQKAACGRWCGFKGPPKTPGRKRNGETLATPVGKRLETDRCPPILRSIDALWGYRCSRLPSPAARTSLTGACCRAQASRHLRDAHGGEEPAIQEAEDSSNDEDSEG